MFIKLGTGLYNNLPDKITQGYLYFTSDTKELYVDISDTERIKVGDIIRVAKEIDLPVLSATEDGKIYYVKETNQLVTYIDGKFVPINNLELEQLKDNFEDIKAETQEIGTKVTAIEEKINSGEIGGSGSGGINFKYNSEAYNTPGLNGGTANWVELGTVSEGKLNQLSDVIAFDPGITNENVGNFSLSDLTSYSTEVVFLDRGSNGTIINKPTNAPVMITIPTKYYTTWLQNAISNDIKSGKISVEGVGGGVSGPLTWGQLKGLTT